MAKSSASNIKLVFTCEHGGYQVPAPFKYFENLHPLNKKAHWNWDPGALEVTKFLSEKLDAAYFANTYSRGLIDCNRSDDNPSRFPKWTSTLSLKERQKLEQVILTPYKAQVRRFVNSQLNKGQHVVLISVHSFTPDWKGRKRKTDVGLLFRPWEDREALLAKEIQSHLKQVTPLNIHLNLPYRGHTDCFSNELSKELNSDKFTALMVEINYGLLHDKDQWISLQWALVTALAAVLG